MSGVSIKARNNMKTIKTYFMRKKTEKEKIKNRKELKVLLDKVKKDIK